MAAPLSAPKLIPEMLTTDAGRKASRRPRAAPSTLAHGRSASMPAPGEDAGVWQPSVLCLTIT
jgi:hypothetical protein